jgi:hypothetical protein
LDYARGITSVSKLSAGDYIFYYPSIGTSNAIAQTQIYGIDELTCVARVVSISLSSCEVKVLSSNGVTRDANVTLTINY